MMRKAVEFAAFVGNGEAVFFPGLVEKGKHAVMKEVEEVAEGFVAGAEAGKNQRGVEMRERALRTGDAHEIHGERWSFAFGPINGLNFAGGKRKGGMSAETRDFIGRIGETSEGLAIGRHAFEQANRLEKFEAVWFLAKERFDFGKVDWRI